MITYRIDNREFIKGGIIPPQKRYQHELDDGKKLVEEILETNRPKDKPKRNEILMLFEKCEDAKRHWIKQIGSRFYKTTISEDDLLHKGDYNKVEEIFKNRDDLVIANKIAVDYWNGMMSVKPIIEIFVHQASVDEVISNSEEERRNEYSIAAFGLARNPDLRRILCNDK